MSDTELIVIIVAGCLAAMAWFYRVSRSHFEEVRWKRRLRGEGSPGDHASHHGGMQHRFENISEGEWVPISFRGPDHSMIHPFRSHAKQVREEEFSEMMSVLSSGGIETRTVLVRKSMSQLEALEVRKSDLAKARELLRPVLENAEIYDES